MFILPGGCWLLKPFLLLYLGTFKMFCVWTSVQNMYCATVTISESDYNRAICEQLDKLHITLQPIITWNSQWSKWDFCLSQDCTYSMWVSNNFSFIGFNAEFKLSLAGHCRRTWTYYRYYRAGRPSPFQARQQTTCLHKTLWFSEINWNHLELIGTITSEMSFTSQFQ